MKRLDRSRPYGRVIGHWEKCPEARLVQGGVYFTGQGEQVWPPAEEAPSEPQSLDSLHWTAVRKLARENGVEWTGNAQEVREKLREIL